MKSKVYYKHATFYRNSFEEKTHANGTF